MFYNNDTLLLSERKSGKTEETIISLCVAEIKLNLKRVLILGNQSQLQMKTLVLYTDWTKAILTVSHLPRSERILLHMRCARIEFFVITRCPKPYPLIFRIPTLLVRRL